MEWSDFKGGSVAARWQVWEYIQSQMHLNSLVFCCASALMRMSIKLTQRVSSTSPDVLFCPDLDQGIHIAGKRLGLSMPDHFEPPAVFIEQRDNNTDLSDQIALLLDSPSASGPTAYQYDLSNGQALVFKKIGDSTLFCYLTGQTAGKEIAASDILKARRQALSKCLPGQSAHVEIWNCTNLDALISRAAIQRFVKTLLGDTLPLVGCFFLDIGCKIRSLVRWRLWWHRPAYPVHCLASLTMSILKAQEQLQAIGGLKEPPRPKIVSKPQWQYGEDGFSVEHEIVNKDIIHSIAIGYLQNQHLKQLFTIKRQIALQIVSAGHAYYLIGSIELLRGGSYKARKRFLAATCKLYRDFPFRMWVFYGAKGKTRAAINLARHKVPYRQMLADDFESALSIIRADKMRRAYLDAPEPGKEQMVLPPAAISALKPGVDSILRHLSNISWEPGSRIHPKPQLPPNHPFMQIFDAIDLINDDLQSIYQERQKAAREQIKLQQQLARSRKMEALGLLAGGVAHDLNNVLAAIVAYPDLLLMALPEDNPLRKKVKTIRDSGEAAAAIVQDLLTMSRRGVNAAQPLNMNSIIEDYLSSPEHDAIAKRHPGISINTELAVDLRNIKSSPVHIRQTIMNLVFNAVEASEKAGTITISTDNRQIDLPITGYETIPAGEYVTLEVKDHGTGIARKDMEHIFEPFYTKKKMGRSGTGLGMTIVWSTVKDSNGYIDLRSTLGQGTLFCLYFPVCNDALPIDPEEMTQENWLGNGESILIVDDESTQREIATEILSRLDYQAAAVDSGERALAALKQEGVDLVIVDMIMDAGIDGLETIRQVRQRHPNQKIIICTGYAEDKRIAEAQTLCNGPLIRKPYSMHTIGKAVYQTLNSDACATKS